MLSTLRVHEIFSSIQGEGLRMGAPSTFVRMAGCNLRCRWCDTSYAFEGGTPMAIEKILRSIDTRQVVLTGGEPLLQNLSPLVEALKGHFLTVETNATVASDLEVDLWSLSPKIGSSGHRADPAISDRFLARFPGRVQLKFVIAEENDLNETKEFLASLRNLGNTPVLLQPEGSGELSEKLDRLRDLVESVRLDPFFKGIDIRVLPQLHQLLWPNEKGK